MTQRKTIGIDLFLEAKHGDPIPERVGAFQLKARLSRGNAIEAQPIQKTLDVGWLTARYLFDGKGEPDAAQIAELVAGVGAIFPWTSLIKLQEIDGKKAFT